MGLRLNDPRSGRSVAVPAQGRRPIAIYVCGPTVYAPAHVGHARTYLYFDVVRRHLASDGLRTRTVMNITDYEDKISDRATATGKTWRSVARASEASFLEELGALGILAPDVTPRASEHVAEMRAAVRSLERLGRTVRREGGLTYVPDRRRPRARSLDAWARRHAVVDPAGPSPGGPGGAEEFGLWLPPHPGGPCWPSPWGRGTPGWHVECYAMAKRYLGLPVDLHGGGRDLAFPHHVAENEIAESLGGRPFARRYLYTEFVTQDGRKMSKSTGELVPLRSALEDAGPDALRAYLLGRPRTEPLAWSWDDLARTKAAVASLREGFGTLVGAGAGGSVPIAGLRSLARGVAHDLSNDLRTDLALARIAEFGASIARAPDPRLRRGSGRAGRALLRGIGERLGIDWTGRAPPARTSGRRARARRAG